MSKSRYRVLNQEKFTPYFITMSTVNWLPLFSNPEIAEVIFNSFDFLQDQKTIEIFAYILMENHLHLIMGGDDLPKQIKRFKTYTARSSIDFYIKSNNQFVLKQLKHEAKNRTDLKHKFWQEGYYPKEIQSEEMMIQKIEYIHNNPVKRGYIELPEHWMYSSARNYAGLKGKIEITQYW